MKRNLLLAVSVFGLLLVALSGRPSWNWSPKALAQAGVCQFAAYGPGGGLINSNITCATPSSGPNVLPSPTSTTTAGAPSLTVTSSPAANTLVAKFPAAGGTSAAFPIPFRQAACYGFTKTSPVTCALSATATSGDGLLALVGYDCTSTITTPSGWSAGPTVCDSASHVALATYTKTSAGTETGISVGAATNGLSVALFEFNGSHTIDKNNTSTDSSGTDLDQFPALTSPTAGAGVIVISSGKENNCLTPSVGSLLPADGSVWTQGSYMTQASAGIVQVVLLGMWQGTAGTNTLNYPWASYPQIGSCGGGDVVLMTLSVI